MNRLLGDMGNTVRVDLYARANQPINWKREAMSAGAIGRKRDYVRRAEEFERGVGFRH